ncbi:thioesterase family protein [Staphylococcus canis]|uniref:Thioesterase n=1 Tax=Staphylococcus canis TaxID=2724942 RepID=A0ABS0T963_9STAP|nr:thioesterase family protein [Staphylococcus canis]MBI5974293.1 thioesterase [Staphylococcus canis]
MLKFPFYDRDKVHQSWIDRNGHMNDSEYARVFSLAIDAFHDQVGLTNEERDARAYTVFTLETHISYLKELKENQAFKVLVSIYNHDEKRTHFFLELFDEETEELCATAETMMMGIDRISHKTAPFPEDIYRHIHAYYVSQPEREWPKQLGHRIDIPKS